MTIATTRPSVAQITVTVIKIIGLAFPARYDELGLSKKPQDLSEGL